MLRNAAFALPLMLCAASLLLRRRKAREQAGGEAQLRLRQCQSQKAKVLICTDEALAALDVQEDALLRRARAKAVTPDAVNAEQDLWISERDACTSAGCLTVAYRRRIRELHNWTN